MIPKIKLNGVAITPQPTRFKWVEREDQGTAGSGHQILGSVRDFEISWGLMSPEDFSAIYDIWYTQGTTGTVVSTLPVLHSGTYVFADYSGTILEEPTVGDYFAQYITNVSLRIRNVTTGR